MFRREFLKLFAAAAVAGAAPKVAFSAVTAADKARFALSKAEWKRRLTPQQYHILRDEGTERPNSSALNNEKRVGEYRCVGCDLTLFKSDMKYDSGTGWPSFFKSVDENIETEFDFKLIYPRTEYHCKRCGGHQGHLFNDGPQPTGQRFCNNGLALNFVPAKA
jgi:peptide-methionine (R)-S-oxide reductase